MTMNKDKTKKHRILRFSLYGILTLALLIVIVLVLATLPPGESVIKGELESILSARLSQPVSIGTFETNLFSHVRLSDITIGSGQVSDSTPDGRISSVFVEYDLWSLLSKQIDINSVMIDTVSVHLLRRKSGRYNLAILDSLMSPADTTKPVSSSSFTFKLGSAFLQSLSIDYTDSLLPLQAYLQNLKLEVESVDSTSGYAFLVRNDSGYFQYSTVPAGPLDINVSGVYTPEAWILDTAHVAIDQMDLAGHGRIVQADQSPIDLSLRLTGNPDRLTEIVAKEFAMPGLKTEGELTSEIKVAGTLAQPKAYADVVLPDLHYNDVKAAHGILFVRWEGDSVFVDSSGVDIFDGRISASGYFLADTILAASVQVSVDNVRLVSLWKAAYSTPSPYKGRLNARFDAAGSGTSMEGWSAGGSVNLSKAVYQGEQLADLNGTFSLDNGLLNASVKQEYFQLLAKADLKKDTLAGHVSLTVADLRPFAGIIRQPELSGSISADADLAGTVQSPRIQAQLGGSKIVYQNLPVDTVAARLTYADSQLVISQLSFAGELKNIDTSAAPMGLQSLKGSYTYAGHASGPLDSLRGQFTLATEKPGYGNISLDSGRVVVTIDGTQVDLDTLSAYKDAVDLQAKAAFDLASGKGQASAFIFDQASGKKPDSTDQPSVVGEFNSTFVYSNTGEISADATGSSIDISALRVLWPDTLDVAGMVGFKVSFRGDRRRPQGSLSLMVERPRYKDVLLDSVRADVSVSPDSVDVRTFDIFSSDERLIANAVVGLERDSLGNPAVARKSPVSGAIKGTDINLKGFEPFLPKDVQATGLASLDLNWDGTLADPNLRGSVNIKNTEVIFAPQDTILSKFNLLGAVQDSTVIFDTASGSVYNTPFTLSGAATLSANNEIRTDLSMTVANVATITGKGSLSAKKLDFKGAIDSLDLAVLRPFVPMVDTISGILDARVSMTGSTDNPVIDGFIIIHGAVVKPELLNERITNGTARITFAGDSLRIDTLNAKLGGGTIALSGRLTHQKLVLTDVNLDLKAKKIKVTSDKLFTVMVDSVDLAYVRKGKDRYLLSGAVDLGNSKLTRNFDFQSILPWANSVKQVNTSLPPIASQTDLDVKVIGGDSLWVDNNIARIRMSADLGVIGSAARPNLAGQVVIQEGYLIYLDRRFTVQQGELYFADPNKLNPDINFLAQADITTYQATQPTSYVISVSVTGNLENPVFSLSSEPPLNQSDIVSVLTLGATLSQLSGQQSTQAGGAQQVLLDRAATLGSEQLAGVVTRRLGNLLDLDQLTVQGSLFNSGAGPGPSVLVAKQVSSRVRLTYSTTVGRVNDQNIRLDYKLTNRLSLQSETDQQGNASLSFKYGFKFK